MPHFAGFAACRVHNADPKGLAKSLGPGLSLSLGLLLRLYRHVANVLLTVGGYWRVLFHVVAKELRNEARQCIRNRLWNYSQLEHVA